MQETGEAALRELADKGVTVRHLSAADTEALAQSAPDFEKVAEDRINELGRRGTAIMNRYRELVADWTAGRLR
jgi:hypothetical protein